MNTIIGLILAIACLITFIVTVVTYQLGSEPVLVDNRLWKARVACRRGFELTGYGRSPGRAKAAALRGFLPFDEVRDVTIYPSWLDDDDLD